MSWKVPTWTLTAILHLAFTLVAAAPALAQQGSGSFLKLERKVPLGAVKGRIDHLAFDTSRQQVFIAELANNTVGIVELGSGRLVHRIGGLREPQGVAYAASADALFVATGGDGMVRLFRGGDFAPIGQLELGSDADNVRVDSGKGLVFVGYGSGALAVIDPANRAKIKDIPLSAHPESFQLSAGATRIFVNVPNAKSIIVLDPQSGGQEIWPTGADRGNFAMALDEENQRVLVLYRNPPKLSARHMRTGAVITERETRGDADDAFLDVRRQRVYVTCGEGFIDVLDTSSQFVRLARLPTRPGARTSLFIPSLDRLAVAVPASASEPAELWIYGVSP
jgi:DNA-binding beta-propeller fold protein YncE